MRGSGTPSLPILVLASAMLLSFGGACGRTTDDPMVNSGSAGNVDSPGSSGKAGVIGGGTDGASAGSSSTDAGATAGGAAGEGGATNPAESCRSNAACAEGFCRFPD